MCCFTTTSQKVKRSLRDCSMSEVIILQQLPKYIIYITLDFLYFFLVKCFPSRNLILSSKPNRKLVTSMLSFRSRKRRPGGYFLVSYPFSDTFDPQVFTKERKSNAHAVQVSLLCLCLLLRSGHYLILSQLDRASR